jgi:hypothetical protein
VIFGVRRAVIADICRRVLSRQKRGDFSETRASGAGTGQPIGRFSPNAPTDGHSTGSHHRALELHFAPCIYWASDAAKAIRSDTCRRNTYPLASPDAVAVDLWRSAVKKSTNFGYSYSCASVSCEISIK